MACSVLLIDLVSLKEEARSLLAVWDTETEVLCLPPPSVHSDIETNNTDCRMSIQPLRDCKPERWLRLTLLGPSKKNLSSRGAPPVQDQTTKIVICLGCRAAEIPSFIKIWI
jgi:hypothetical protein